jgi:hypothetical protein
MGLTIISRRLILKIAALYLIVEAIVSVLFSEDRRVVSMVGRIIRIIIGFYLLYISA